MSNEDIKTTLKSIQERLEAMEVKVNRQGAENVVHDKENQESKASATGFHIDPLVQQVDISTFGLNGVINRSWGF